VEVVPGGAAARAGMLDGDRVVQLGKTPIATFDQLRGAVQQSTGRQTLLVERRGRRVELVLEPENQRIGVVPASRSEPVSFAKAAMRAAGLPLAVMKATATGFADLFRESERPQLSGPVGIVREVQRSPNAGSTWTLLASVQAYFWPLLAFLAALDLPLSRLRKASSTTGPEPAR
jgi:regulator of sigma E protease